ncbi:hypothetical protein, partial [Bacteroides sp. An279]|uniref:hypothetical protein n=1 Tax=Bacteroides sp. An279 TaxID=1965620 RepID=UPI000B56FA18
DEEQERKEPKNRPKHTRKRIHQAKKNFLEKFKTASKCSKQNWLAKLLLSSCFTQIASFGKINNLPLVRLIILQPEDY